MRDANLPGPAEQGSLLDSQKARMNRDAALSFEQEFLSQELPPRLRVATATNWLPFSLNSSGITSPWWKRNAAAADGTAGFFVMGSALMVLIGVRISAIGHNDRCPIAASSRVTWDPSQSPMVPTVDCWRWDQSSTSRKGLRGCCASSTVSWDDGVALITVPCGGPLRRTVRSFQAPFNWLRTCDFVRRAAGRPTHGRSLREVLRDTKPKRHGTPDSVLENRIVFLRV